MLVLVLQTREVWKEARIANEVAGTRAHRELLGMLGRVYDRFFEHPELRSHFYGNASAEPTATERIRLTVIAEELADILQVALDTTQKLAASTGSPASGRDTPRRVSKRRPFFARRSAAAPEYGLRSSRWSPPTMRGCRTG